MILCRSDLNLETIPGNQDEGLGVYPDLYKCWDWHAVYEAAEKNQERLSAT